MKKNLISLSLLICVLVPITQVQNAIGSEPGSPTNIQPSQITLPDDPAALGNAILAIGKNQTISSTTTLVHSLLLTVTKHSYFKNMGITQISPKIERTIRNNIDQQFKKLSISGMSKDIAIGIAIDIATKCIDDQYGHKVAGGSWYVMKQSVALAKAGTKGKGGGFLIALSYEQSALLVDVIQKDIEEYSNARSAIDSATESQLRLDLLNYQLYEGRELIKKYKNTTSEADRKEILNDIKKGARGHMMDAQATTFGFKGFLAPDRKKLADNIFANWEKTFEGKLLKSQLTAQANINALISIEEFDKAEQLSMNNFGTNTYAMNAISRYKIKQHFYNKATEVTTETDEKIYLSSEEESEELAPILLVNTERSPSQEELAQRAKDLSAITNKNKSIRSLNSNLQDKRAKLQALEAENNVTNQQQNKVSASELATAKKEYLISIAALSLYEKYNGDINKLSKRDLRKLKELAINLGRPKLWQRLFKGSETLKGIYKTKYEELQNRYVNNEQQFREAAELSKKIARLRKEISQLERTINHRVREMQHQMANVEDTVDDYLESEKVNIATEASGTSIDHDWRGHYTFHSENKSDGKLRYWGGNWGDTAEALEDGGSDIFMMKNNDPDSVESVHFEHGDNSATDNTMEFDVAAHEISTNPAFHNENIKTLKIQKNLANGDTLKFETTGHYSYTAWGEWSQTGGLRTEHNGGSGVEQMAMHNNWAVGQATEDLPRQGSATYNGVAQGHWYTAGDLGNDANRPSYGGGISGTVSMTVNFANTSVVAGVLDLHKVGGGNFATATMDNMQINRESSAFAGRLIGPNIAPTQSYNNKIHGQFNGSAAEEISGHWTADHTNGEFASGVFAGER